MAWYRGGIREGAARPMTTENCDSRALRVAERVHRRERPYATILFGSRARGDHEEDRSDIDIMLVLQEAPDSTHREYALEWAEEVAHATYGRRVPVQLVWLDEATFRENQHYCNHVATRALDDGVVVSNNPEEFRSHYINNEGRGMGYDWSDYEARLENAEGHLGAFADLDILGYSDSLLGKIAQGALEHAMKAVIAGHGGDYPGTHQLGLLLGSVRRIDPELRTFSLSISPDIYSDYAGINAYRGTREQPRLTDQDNYRERTVNDAQTLIDRAQQLRPNPPP